MDSRPVLVYTDGRPECERALAIAASPAKRTGGGAHALRVHEPPLRMSELDVELDEAITNSQLEELERLRSLARGLGVGAGVEARTGRPFEEIILACQREGCALVVKVAMGRSRLAWPLLGSTPLHLIRSRPVPVWLVGERPEPVPRRIMALLASDPASDECRAPARRVLEVACSFAESTGAKLTVLIRGEAEEVIDGLETSMVAMKPDGFVSPLAAAWALDPFDAR